MFLLNFLLFLLFGINFGLGKPVGERTSCANPRVRREWRTLEDPEKLEYIRAVKCLFSLPSKGTEYWATKTRFDDFAANHINATTAFNPNDPGNRWTVGPGIHVNGVFLPWHRYYLWTYEEALIDECNYKGTQPYWDYTLDNPTRNSTFSASPVFSPTTGFGGNGGLGLLNVSVPLDFWTVQGSCITDGPFANEIVNLGPTYNLHTPNPHCIQRNIQNAYANNLLQWDKDVLPLLQLNEFANFSYAINAGFSPTAFPGIHAVGHYSVGGEMLNIWSSSNDPLFFMHHAQIDRVWSLWQSLHPARLYAMGGPIYPNGTGTTYLNYTMEMAPFIAPDRPIKEVMDTYNRDGQGILCYKYEEDGQLVPGSVNTTAGGI